MIDWKAAAKLYRKWLKEANSVSNQLYRQASNFEQALELAQDELEEAQESMEAMTEANKALWDQLEKLLNEQR